MDAQVVERQKNFGEFDRFQYLRSFFPPANRHVDFDSADSLAPGAKRNAEVLLQDALDSLQADFAREVPTLAYVLADTGMILPTIGHWDRARVRIIDDGTAVAGATDRDVLLSARVLRGFLVGSLREGVQGSSPSSSLLTRLVGWAPEPPDAPSNAEWERRLRLLLDMLSSTPVYAQSDLDQGLLQQRIGQLLGSETPTPGATQFDALATAVLAGRETISPVDAYIMQSALLFFSIMLAEPAERFLIAHEFGHVVLHHAEDLTADCAALIRQEQDADTLATALLVYADLPSLTDIYLYLGSGAGDPEPYFEIYGDSVRYGFPHAFRYGIAESGLGTGEASECSFPSGELRHARVAALWRQLLLSRLRAVGELADYGRRHPPVALRRTYAAPISWAQEQEMLTAGRLGCGDAAARLDRSASILPNDPLPHVYVVYCARAMPSESDFTIEIRRRAGEGWLEAFLTLYRLAAEAE